MVIIPEQVPFIQPLQTEWHQPYVADISMLRLDVIHPVVSGNKWYKLKHNITCLKMPFKKVWIWQWFRVETLACVCISNLKLEL